MSEEQNEIRMDTEPLPGGTEIAVGSGGDEESTHVEIPDVLPVLPLKNTVLFPYLLAPLLVNTDRSRELIDAVLRSPDRLLVCVGGRGLRLWAGHEEGYSPSFSAKKGTVPYSSGHDAPYSARIRGHVVPPALCGDGRWLRLWAGHEEGYSHSFSAK